MKKVLMTICLILFSSVIVFAEEETESDFSTSVTFDVFSKYMWRGQVVNDDPVFQPGVEFGYKNWTAAIWGNMDLTSYNDQADELTEVDYTLAYSDQFPFFEADWLSYSVGAIHYRLPGDESLSTSEVFFGISIESFLNPSVMVYHDIDEVRGTYVAFGVSHSVEKLFEISPDMPVGMEISSNIGWGNKSYNRYCWAIGEEEIDKSGFNDLSLSVSFPVELGEWTLAPSINYVTLLNKDIRASDSCSDKSDFLFTGISLSREF